MGLSIGIVELPNVGKSTLFNALLKKQRGQFQRVQAQGRQQESSIRIFQKIL